MTMGIGLGLREMGEAVSKAMGTRPRVWGQHGLRYEKGETAAAGKLGEKRMILAPARFMPSLAMVATSRSQ